MWLTLWTLINQSRPPDRLLLVLARDEFPGSVLPARVERLRALGLEVLWVPSNIRSYKKLLPALEANPDEVIVTADDDILYPRDWLADLVAAHEADRGAIVAHRANAITLVDRRPAPYLCWRHADTRTPDPLVFPTGAGGVLYPPGSLPVETLDSGLALRLCPTADDVWFKAMSLLAWTRVKTVSDQFREFHNSLSSQRTSLISRNASTSDVPGRTRNDDQLEAVFDRFDLWSRLS